MRRHRTLGGFFSIVALFLVAGLLSIAVVEYKLVPTYSRSLSPQAPPFPPVGRFNFSVQLHSAPACDSPIIDGPTTAQLQGVHSQAWRLDSDGSCSMYWACDNCVLTSSLPFTASFALTDPNVYAAGMDYSLTFPGFTATPGSGSDNAPFVLTSSLWPSQPFVSVFRGDLATQISVSLVPVVLRSAPPQVCFIC